MTEAEFRARQRHAVMVMGDLPALVNLPPGKLDWGPVVNEPDFRGPKPAANWVQIDAAELAYLRETVAAAKRLRDKAAAVMAHLCDSNPSLPLDTAWLLGELADAVTEYDGD